MQITITNAEITSEDGTVTKAKITGDATLTPPVPGEGDPHPSHPILLPPETPPGGPDSFWMLCFCPNPPPPHWEWISFTPGSPPERPQPVPPEPPVETTPPGVKPPPSGGGWGFWPGVGWVYYPGPREAGPKRR
jgi:hypothetical protein